MFFKRWFKKKETELERWFAADRHKSLPYRLCPPQTEDQGILIVYLHGAGGAGSDNQRQLQRGSGYALESLRSHAPGAWILAPQCSAREGWHSRGPAPSPPAQLLLELVEELRGRHQLTRVFLLGVSMGGHGVWDLGWRRPQLWHGLVPVCGAAPPGKVEQLAQTPIWCFHGELDQEVPVEGSRRVVESLRRAGAKVHYTELPGVGHSCTREVFSRDDFVRWLLTLS